MQCQFRQSVECTYNRGGTVVIVNRCLTQGRCVENQLEQSLVGVESVQVCRGQAAIEFKFEEPVGTKLAEIIAECGLIKPEGCSVCNAWTLQMNAWGVSGCLTHKAAIISHLNEQAKLVKQKRGGWLDMIQVGLKGYFSTESMFFEAIRRASN